MERVHGQVMLLAHERKLRWKDNLACIGTLSVAFTFFVPHRNAVKSGATHARKTTTTSDKLLVFPHKVFTDVHPNRSCTLDTACGSFAVLQLVPAAEALQLSSWSSYSVPWEDTQGFHVAFRTTHPLN